MCIRDRYLVTKPKFELNFYAEAKVFEGLKVNLGYEYVPVSYTHLLY